MKFFYEDGLIQKVRRFMSESASVRDEDVKEPGKLAEILRQLSRRLTNVESSIPPEALEFEVTCGSTGSTVTILHNLNSAIRWYVTSWTQIGGSAYPTNGPQLVQDATSDADSLVLRSYVAGKAIVRVEPSSGQIEPGITVAATKASFALSLSADATTTSATQVSTGLEWPTLSGEKWHIQFTGFAGDSNVAGMKFSVGTTGTGACEVIHKSSTVNVATRAYQVISAVNTLSNAIHTVAGGKRDDQITGTVEATSDGTMFIGFASVAGTATLYKYSTVIVTKVS